MLNFQDRPKAFASGAAKIQYAISYLSSPALQYFEPAILSKVTPKPVWLTDWDSFHNKLEMNFSPFDNAAQAKTNWKKLL